MLNKVDNQVVARCTSSIVRTAMAWLGMALLVSAIFWTNNVKAQTPSTEDKIAAVITVINYLLLGETGQPIDVDLGKLDTGQYGHNYGSGNHRDGLDIQFDGQAQDISFCLEGVDIQAGEIIIELNGVSIGTLQNGENCFTFTAAQQLEGNVLSLIHTNPGERWGVTNIGFDRVENRWLTLDVLSRTSWDNLAVRKVLQVFAFGGQATDAQIQSWADMSPEHAIREMLNFSPHNSKLSPLPNIEQYPDLINLDGTLWEFRNFLGDPASNLPIPSQDRSGLGVDHYDDQGAWIRMTTARGFNPFRQKIGYWETNYHLAVNRDAAVTSRQLTYYYDVIMNAHADDLPYQEVLAEASKSAAVAFQYGHNENRWVRESVNGGYRNGDFICECNEDFAREIHQLFFGILGEQDPLGMQHHEDVTIPETAKALTDMRVEWDNENERFPEVVDFQTEYHHAAAVDVLNTQISGPNAADKIDAIAAIAIDHPESLNNLPIIIISGLADDDLSVAEQQSLRAAWAAMPSKRFLEFIQAYAVSELFHAPDRVKFFPSIDRFMNLATKLVLNNTEALTDLYAIGARWSGARSFFSENVTVFRPLHNVFGGQTGIEASDSPAVLENNYNRFTNNAWYQYRGSCETCNNGNEWRKDWGSVIPTTGGEYTVEGVANWLWQHFVSDGGKNYTQIERAHILALMATDRDLNQLYCVQQRRIAENIQPLPDDLNNNRTALELLERDNPWDNVTHRRCDDDLSPEEIALLETGFSSAQIESPAIANLINEMGDRTLALDSDDDNERREANQEVGQAINFILATPFMMAQEAR